MARLRFRKRSSDGERSIEVFRLDCGFEEVAGQITKNGGKKISFWTESYETYTKEELQNILGMMVKHGESL